MPRSDDDYDLVHTYDQGKAGKSKTSRPAVRELGREGAATETILMEETGEPRTPPAGVRFLFFDGTGDLQQKNPDGSVQGVQTATGAPTDAEYVTTATDGDLSAESLHSGLSGSDLHDPATHGSTHTSGGSDSLDAQALSNFSHGSTHQDGGADEIQADTLAGDNGSAGQVLQTDGSSLSFESVGGNVPDWTEDANSPFTLSNASSRTMTLSGTFDLVRMIVTKVSSPGAINESVELRLNGIIGTSYNVSDQSGGQAFNSDSVEVATIRDSSGTAKLTPFEVLLVGDSADMLGGSVRATAADAGLAKSFGVPGKTPPLNSVTLFRANSDFSATVEFYGRDGG